MQNEKKLISLELPNDLKALVKSESKKLGMNMSSFIRYVLIMYFCNNDKTTP